MYSDLNYALGKDVKTAYGLTQGQFVDLVTSSRLKLIRRYTKHLVTMDNIGKCFYSDRENVVLKRWEAFSDVNEKFNELKDKLDCFPRCFFRMGEATEGFYRVFYEGRALKIVVFVLGDGFMRSICYSRGHSDDLEILYKAYEDGRIDWEG